MSTEGFDLKRKNHAKGLSGTIQSNIADSYVLSEVVRSGSSKHSIF